MRNLIAAFCALMLIGMMGCGGGDEEKTCEQTCQDTGGSTYNSCLANGGEEQPCLQQGESAYQQCAAMCGGGNGGGNNGGAGGNNGGAGGNNGGGNGGNNGGGAGGNNGGGGAGGGGGMIFDPPGSTLPPDVAACERGCLQVLYCAAGKECAAAVSASLINRCRSACADEAQRNNFIPLENQACPGAGTSALDALGLTGTCVGRADACETAMMPCMSGEDCQGGACQPFVCTPDMNEPNGSEAATPIDLGGEDAVVLGMSLCSAMGAEGEMVGDEDWYQIRVPAGAATIVELGFKTRIGDVDLKAFLPNALESPMHSAVSGSDNERMVIAPADVERTVLLQVYTFMGAQNNYDLYVTHDVPLQTCGLGSAMCDDGFACVDRVCERLPPCASDEDCDFNRLCEVATGICRSCLGDADCGENRVCEDFRCTECRQSADCEEGVCSEGSCVACIADQDCAEGTCVDNTCRSAACDDPYEPNDSEDLGAALPAGQDTNGAYHCGDDDFYRFNVPAGQSAYISLLFVDEEGDLDLAITKDGEAVTRSVGTSDNEYVGIPAGDGGNYTARVYKFGADSQAYSLRVDLNPAFAVCIMDEDCGEGLECDSATAKCVEEGACMANRDCGPEAPLCNPNTGFCEGCQPDQFEPNDDLMTPIDVNQVPAGAMLNTCGGPDFFEVNVPAGATLVVDVLFSHEQGDIDVRVFDGMGGQAANGVSTTDNENVEFLAQMGGKYTVEVFGFRDVYNTYSLSVSTR